MEGIARNFIEFSSLAVFAYFYLRKDIGNAYIKLKNNKNTGHSNGENKELTLEDKAIKQVKAVRFK